MFSDNQRSRSRRLTEEGAWITGGQLASFLGALALVRVLTEMLDPVQYGQLALGLSAVGLVNQTIMGGVTAGIGRFYSIAVEKNDVSGYMYASRRMLVAATLGVLLLAVVIITALVTTGLTAWVGFAVVATVFSIISGYNNTFSSMQNAARQRAVVALHGAIDAWLKILLAVGLMFWLGTTKTVVLLGFTSAAVLVVVSQGVFVRHLAARQGDTHPRLNEQDWTRKMSLFSYPFCLWGVFTWAQQASDRWSLEIFTDTFTVGQYAAVFQLGYAPVGLITGLITTLIGPLLYQRAGAAEDSSRNASVHRIAWRITNVSLLLTSSAFLITWLFHDALFRLLVANTFRDASYLLPWIVLAGGLFASGQMLSLKIMSELRSHALLVTKLTTALLGVAANLIGAWLFGVNGVVGGLVFFSALFFVCTMLLAKNIVNANHASSTFH